MPQGSSRIIVAAVGAIAVSTAAHAGITNFILYHSNTATQTGAGLSPEVASLQAVGLSSGGNDFDGGAITSPDGTVTPIFAEDFGTFGYYRGDPVTHPFGVYTLNLTNSVTHTTGSVSTDYTADYYPSTAPLVSNYDALQHFNPLVDTTVTLASGFTADPGAADTGTTFYIADEVTNQRLLELIEPASTTSFFVPANTAMPGEKLGFYFEFDVDRAYTDPATGLPTTNEFRNITVGDINAATTVPEPMSWALMVAGFGVVGCSIRRRQRDCFGEAATPANNH